MTSVMPQGVEHTSGPGLRQHGEAGVMTSVMPQGVEHVRHRRPCPQGSRVMTSVMPQGVEHTFSARSQSSERSCDDLRDAARR